MDVDSPPSCDGFPSDSTTSSKSAVNFPCPSSAKARAPAVDPSCSNIFSTTSSSSSTMMSAYFGSECQRGASHRKEPPNIGYELAIAKAIMQQYSTISGDNLFDHLSDIIKRVIDERPPNVIDFFEEFSRNVREQKLHLPERFPPDGVFDESRMYRMAKKMLISMKLPAPADQPQVADEHLEEEENKSQLVENLRIDIDALRRFICFNERVQHLQFFWNQCGFGINSDDIFQLACAMDRLQTHPSILTCRFWGMINGLKASYYIVEAYLARDEINTRLEQMEKELREKQRCALENLSNKDKPLPSFVGPELTPGNYGWENYDEEELEQMKPQVAPIPLVEVEDSFNVPPEKVGLGTNRFSYFVVNTVSDDWIELPIVTPSQIEKSREIKKFLTGDLEAEIMSYPYFPGKEKHYLRAMISRITAGTYIAPRGYYRKMTKRELRLHDGIEDDEEEEEEEEESMGEDEEEEGEIDNDIMLVRNERYEPEPLLALTSLDMWVHVRANILKQGRVAWYDMEKARKERAKELARLLRLKMMEEMGEEEEQDEENEMEDEEDEEGGEEMSEDLNPPETGPPLLNPCHLDESDQDTIPWVTRFTSKYTNKIERILILQSNVWPGSYTFTYDKLCESIYMGWGHKYVARNMSFKHLPNVVSEFPLNDTDFVEATDPTPADEEEYRLCMLKKEFKMEEHEEHLADYDDEGAETLSENE